MPQKPEPVFPRFSVRILSILAALPVLVLAFRASLLWTLAGLLVSALIFCIHLQVMGRFKAMQVYVVGERQTNKSLRNVLRKERQKNTPLLETLGTLTLHAAALDTLRPFLKQAAEKKLEELGSDFRWALALLRHALAGYKEARSDPARAESAARYPRTIFKIRTEVSSRRKALEAGWLAANRLGLTDRCLDSYVTAPSKPARSWPYAWCGTNGHSTGVMPVGASNPVRRGFPTGNVRRADGSLHLEGGAPFPILVGDEAHQREVKLSGD